MGETGGTVATPIPHHGVLIDVVIKAPGSQFAGIKTKGLIDTGADFVLISPAIARQLQLRHTNDDIVGGIGGGEVDAKVYSGSIEVPELGFQRILPLYAVAWDPTSHAVLLGRSFLKYFVFRYDGPSETFHFSNPLVGGYHPDAEDG
jgi:predicted aspartyl protease